MKTFLPKLSEIKRAWVEVDAADFTLGRLATRVANLLHGKHKTTFTPHMDTGDFVVVINAKNVRFTGRKLLQKEYIRHTGYPGGIRRKTLGKVMDKNPRYVIFHAVRNMLPTNKLRQVMIKRLKIVEGDKHNFKIDRKLTK
ncbi:50S ribosomal protein L13 [bacterium]|nr:MAG: 50S ribosomal protein L13 [bacterium]